MLKQYGSRLDSEVVDLAREVAVKEDRSLNYIINRWLKDGFAASFSSGTMYEKALWENKDFSSFSVEVRIRVSTAKDDIEDARARGRELGYA